MILSAQDKGQILLASREELTGVDIQYGSIYRTYQKVLEYMYGLAQRCHEFVLRDEIREVKKRPTIELKDRETTKEKILRKRAEGWKNNNPGLKNYKFDSVTDIIAFKIICGYLSDQPLVEQWIRNTFDVVDRESVEYASGYMSWHYIVRLKEEHVKDQGLPDDWTSVPCEIQVKTLLQEAWDGKTHDLVYRKGDVSKFEQEQFHLLSKALHVADTQSEMFRLEIEEARKEEQQRRQAALQEYFVGTQQIAEQVGYETKEEMSEDDVKAVIDKMQLRAKEIDEIDQMDSREEKRELLRLGVTIFLETLKEEAKKWTLDYARQMLDKHRDDAFIWCRTATVYWALRDRYASLETVVRAIDIAERQNNDEERNHAIRGLTHYIAEYGREDLRDLGFRLLGEAEEESATFLETKGLFLIKIAMTEAEIEEGKLCLARSIEVAEKSQDKQLVRTAQAFCDLDRLIADRKLKGLRLAGRLRPSSPLSIAH